MRFIGFISFLACFITRLFAQEFDGSAPTVPSEVMAKGRQETVSYLGGQVDSVSIKYEGKSVFDQGAENYLYLDRDSLRSRGYVDDGSLSQLRAAIAGYGKQMRIIQLPNGGYDVSAVTSFRSSSYQTVLEGRSYFSYSREKDGLLVGRSVVYISLPKNISLQTAGHVYQAEWISRSGLSAQLATHYSENDQATYITVPTDKIEDGLIAYSNSYGGITVIDFGQKTVTSGVRAILTIAEVRGAGDIALYVDSGDKYPLGGFCSNAVSFYRSQGQIYGRFPVVDINTPVKIDETLDFKVRVWGTSSIQYVSPKNIRVRVIRTLDGSISPGVYQPVIMKGGGWLIQLPPGAYQIYTDFEGVLDPSQDSGPGVA